MHAWHTARSKRALWWLRCLGVTCLCVFAIVLEETRADTSFQTQAYFKCTEPEPPFDSSSCNHFTQYAALVDLTGGGKKAQVIRVVGSRSTPLLNLKEHDNGTLECPPGVACTPLDTEDLEVSIVRSPLPAGIPRILPGGNVSIGFYWRLTRNNQYSSDYRVPYSYEVANCSGSTPHSSCDGSSSSYPAATGVEFRTFNPFEADNGLDIDEPTCGAECETGDASTFNLRGTCGDNVPSPTGYLADNDGRCSELCCGASTSIKVRQLQPFCYMMSVEGSPGVAVDFAVEVRSKEIGDDPIVVSVYGVSDPQTTFTNVSAGVRVRIWSLVNDFGRFDDTDAFSVVHGSIVMCPNHTQTQGDLPARPIFPNEVNGPVANVSELEWFYMPTAYVPFYRDATAAQAAQIIKPTLPVDTLHPKLFGESGSVVEQAAAGFIERQYGEGAAGVAQCANLSGVLPLVPGYDTDEPITDAAPYELPSPCYMWSQARKGNQAFLPPSADTDQFNWFVRRGIRDDARNDAVYDPTDLYLVYVPTAAQIEAVEAERAFEDGMLLSVEMSDTVATYASSIKVPVTTALSSSVAAPSCTMPLPKDVDGFSATGTLAITVASALDAPLDAGETPDPVFVSLSCVNVDGDSVPVHIRPSVTQNATLTYQQQKRFQYSVEFTFSKLYSKFSKHSQVADCVVRVTGASVGNGAVGPIPCSAGGPVDPKDHLPDCDFWDVQCQHDDLGKDYIKIGAIQAYIGIATAGLTAIALMIAGVVMANTARKAGTSALRKKTAEVIERAHYTPRRSADIDRRVNKAAKEVAEMRRRRAGER